MVDWVSMSSRDLAWTCWVKYNTSRMSSSGREVRRTRRFIGSFPSFSIRASSIDILVASAPLSSKASMTTTTFPVAEPSNWDRGSTMNFCHWVEASAVLAKDGSLITLARSGRRRRSRSVKSRAMVANSMVWSPSCCLTRVKQKHDPSIPRWWAWKATAWAIADLPVPAWPLSQKTRGAVASVVSIQSMISFRISVLVPPRDFCSKIKPTPSAQVGNSKLRSSQICCRPEGMSRSTPSRNSCVSLSSTRLKMATFVAVSEETSLPSWRPIAKIRIYWTAGREDWTYRKLWFPNTLQWTARIPVWPGQSLLEHFSLR